MKELKIPRKGQVKEIGDNIYTILCISCDNSKTISTTSGQKARRNFKRNRWEKHYGNYYCSKCNSLSGEELDADEEASLARIKWKDAKKKSREWAYIERKLFAEYRITRGRIISKRQE